MKEQLLNSIENYLIGRVALRDLETWLLSNLQAILDSGDETAIRLANESDADLVQFNESLIDEGALRKRLESYMAFASTVPIDLSAKQAFHIITVGSTTETITDQVDITKTINDYHFALGFA